MNLKIRILLAVSCLFFFCTIAIFSFTGYEMTNAVSKEKILIDKTINKTYDKWNYLLELFLHEKFMNIKEELTYVFKKIGEQPMWRIAFLPDNFNIKTGNWAIGSALLKTFPWIDFINVKIDGENSAYIDYSKPYMRNFMHIKLHENCNLFVSNDENNELRLSIGIPFLPDKRSIKTSKSLETPEYDLSEAPSHWFIYSLDQILNIDFTKYHIGTEKHPFPDINIVDDINTLTIDEYKFVLKNIRDNIKTTRAYLQNSPNLLSILQSKNKSQIFLQPYLSSYIKDFEIKKKTLQQECKNPICEYSRPFSRSPWYSPADFNTRTLQRELGWNFFNISQLGAWDYDPFQYNAPIGFIRSTRSNIHNKYHIDKGIYMTDIIHYKPIPITQTCIMTSKSPKFDKEVIFKDNPNGSIESCSNRNLHLYKNGDSDPFILSTLFIKMKDSKSDKGKTSSITLGISIDNILRDVALSTGEIFLLTKDQGIRFYDIDGNIKDIKDMQENNKKLLFNKKSGVIIDTKGNQAYFSRIGQLTKDDGYLVLLTSHGNRLFLINFFSNIINKTLKRVLMSGIFIAIVFLVMTCLILSRVISKITRPIKTLANATHAISKGNYKSINLPDIKYNKNDEVGELYTSFFEMVHSLEEGEKIRGLLDKVVSKEVATKILEEGVNLAGEIKYMTIMFCDIRSFTSITEKMNPKDVLIMLNECITLLSGVIDKYSGVIDSYEGDRIMTLFGAPLACEDHNTQALLCAVEMQQAIKVWNSERKKYGFCELEIGIGIHTGEAVAGNVGTENHLSYSVLGAIVNLTSRLCDTARGYEILLTKETLEGTKDISHIEYEEQEPKKFRGFSTELVTYKIKIK